MTARHIMHLSIAFAAVCIGLAALAWGAGHWLHLLREIGVVPYDCLPPFPISIPSHGALPCE
jgi:hypothetical protein